MRSSKLLLVLLATSLCACFTQYDDPRYEVEVINLEGLNTPYDDYNSAGPTSFDGELSFVYSTNYPSEGAHFDIARGYLEFWRPGPEEGDAPRPLSLSSSREGLFLDATCNSDAHEYGPAFIADSGVFFGELVDDTRSVKPGYYLFASDREGDLDIYYYNESVGLNAFAYNRVDADDAYPIYDAAAGEVLFASNRGADGVFDIFSVDGVFEPSGSDDFLGVAAGEPSSKAALGSPANDTCPYILGDVLVFASDRDGGFGGYDLYVSVRTGDGWGAPVNLGPEINGAANEFRPSLYKEEAHGTWDRAANDAYVLLFSSDRDGGAGGYDLHMTFLPDNVYPDLF